MANGTPIVLFDGQTADGNGDAKSNGGGLFVVSAEGDFGGGTVTLQTSRRGTYWQDVYFSDGTQLEISATANYASQIVLKAGLLVRAVLTGATAADITVELV